MEIGFMIDEDAQRFVVLTFKEPDGDPVSITFTVPLFQNYLRELQKAGHASMQEQSWQAAH
jgi:hypothetical protein